MLTTKRFIRCKGFVGKERDVVIGYEEREHTH